MSTPLVPPEVRVQTDAQSIGSSRISPALVHLARAVSTLREDPQNARAHPERNLDAIRASLAKFGQQKPIVASRDGIVVAGNGTLAAARSLGWSHLAVVESDLDADAARAFAVADNRTAELAEWDVVQLAEALKSLPADLSALVGFNEAEMRRVAAEAQAAIEASLAGDALDEVLPLPETAVSTPGDLYLLGRHRLLCGDATCPADVARVLDGAKPFLAVMDPPYGVEYDPSWRNAAGLSDTSRTGTVRNDDRVDWREAYGLFPGDVIYVWHAGRFAAQAAEGLEASGFQIRAQLIWRKPRFAISRGAYHWAHEPLWYAVRDGASARWCGDRSQSTVWEIAGVGGADAPEDDDATVHGTQKPVECMARPMRNHGVPGDGVYDGFVGSGSTIVAAERLDRVAFAMELDPRYVDVAVARFEKLSGKKAERVT